MKAKMFFIIGPGLLIAATGVGAGDLATAAFTGSNLGVGILWVVLLGAFFKYVLNEGLTRWQLSTGTTIIEGAVRRAGKWSNYVFLIYFLVWSFLVAAALMSASGVALHALFPVFDDPANAKIYWGILQSALGILLVRLGGYRLFEKVMMICIGLMFITVVVTAVMITSDWISILKGLVAFQIPQLKGPGLSWTIALMGGIGGTVTILCYGYWIREEGRFGTDALKISRMDLITGYVVTAVFGLAMVIIGSTVQIEGRGAGLIVNLANELNLKLGAVPAMLFRIGAWAAIFSSLLGVWQSVPYLFCDIINQMHHQSDARDRIIDTNSKTYVGYLYGLATIPIIGLWVGFAHMQKLYAITGALFIPLLALILLILNGSSKYIDPNYRNKPATTVVLVMILIFFFYAGSLTILRILAS